MTILKWLFGGLFSLSLLGCGGPKSDEFGGSIQFLNQSGVDVYWVTMQGFQSFSGMGNDIGPGRFVVGANANMVLGRMKYPNSCTVVWRYKNGGAPQKQTLNLGSIAPEKRVGMLVFRFGKDKKWTFSFEPAPDYMK